MDMVITEVGSTQALFHLRAVRNTENVALIVNHSHKSSKYKSKLLHSTIHQVRTIEYNIIWFTNVTTVTRASICESLDWQKKEFEYFLFYTVYI